MRRGLKPIAGPLGQGLDMVDGGPDGADIALQAAFSKQEMPHFAGFSAQKAAISAPGAHLFDDGDGGADAGLDIEVGIVQRVGVGGRAQRRDRPVLVALVTLEDVGQDRFFVGALASGKSFPSVATCAVQTLLVSNISVSRPNRQ